MKNVKFLAVAIIMALSLCFVGCGSDDDGDDATMTAKVTFSEDITVTKATIKYGNSNDETQVETIDLEVTDNTCSLSLTDKYGYWKIYSVRAYNGEDEVYVTFKTGPNNDGAWVAFEEDQTVTFTYAKKEAETMTLTLTFSDFEASSVSITYGNSDDSDVRTTVSTSDTSSDVAISSDKTSATVTIKNDYTGSYAKIYELTVSDENGEIEITTEEDVYWEFSKDTTHEITYETVKQKAELIPSATASSLADSTFTSIVSASDFTNAVGNTSVGRIYITVTNAADFTDDGWVSFTSSESWTGSLDEVLKKSNKTVSTNSKTFIENAKTNGLYVVGKGASSVTISIKYAEGEPFDDVVHEVAYTYGEPVKTTTGVTNGGEIAAATVFADTTIDAIKIVASDVTGDASDWWFTPLAGSDTWLNDYKLAWQEGDTYETVIADETTITTIKTNGLQLGLNDGLSVTVNVYVGTKAAD